MEERLLEAEPQAVAHRAAQDAAQHVAAAFVAGHHTVGEQEADRAQVIGHHAHRQIVGRDLAVALAGEVGGGVEQRLEQVGVVVRRHALQHRRDALEAGAGVDRRVRQRHQLAARLGVELHEHQVPELEVAAAVTALVPRHRRDDRAAGRCGSRCTARRDRSRPSTRSCPSCRSARCATRAGS